MVLSFVLFVPTALILLGYPWFNGDVRVALAAALLCVACAIVMGWVARSLSDNLPFVFTSYVLLLLLIFFSLERLLGYAARWPQMRWLAGGPQWIPMISSIVVSAGAAIVLPHVRSMTEVSASLRKEHEKFLAAAESSLDDFYIFDGIPDASGAIVDFRFAYLNPNAERRLETGREKLVGKVLTEVRPFMISSGLIHNYREVVRTGVPFIGEVFIDDDIIKATWLNVQAIKLGDGLAITSRDVTERRRVTDHISHLAHYDQLTGLPNRTLMQDRLQTAILRARRNHQRVAVFMLDIDQFKSINDSLGHSSGDALLVAVGKRLRSSVRESDTIARMGGDEFVIIMADFQSLEDVERCALQIVERAAKPIVLGDREINVTVSVGLCIYPDSGLEAEQLLRNADAAMYVVKNSGRNGVRIFTEGMLDVGKDEG
jgi:diguanylate cyclase (GGDEF)-like protein